MHRQFAWILSGNLAYAVAQASVLVVLAKLGTPRTVGEYGLALAVAAPVILLANLQLSAVVATDSTGVHRFADAALARAWMLGIANCVILVVWFALRSAAFGGVVLPLVALMKTVESGSDLLYGLMQKHERMRAVAVSLYVRSGGMAVAAFVGMTWFGSLEAAVAAIAAAWLLVLMLHDIPAVRRLPGAAAAIRRPSLANAREIVVVTIPLGIASVLDSIGVNIPRYYLQGAGGAVAVGYYSALAYLVLAGTTMVNALAHSFRPRLAAAFYGDPHGFRRLLRMLVGLCLALGVLGVILALGCGKTILRALFAAEYAEHAPVLVILMIGAAVWYQSSIANVVLTIGRMYRVQTRALLAFCVVVATSGAVLIPDYGLFGAAFAFVLGMVTRAVIVWVVALRVIRTNMMPA